MAPNFIGCDREQAFLMPPSLREWLPEDHLVWTVLDAVEEMELGAFYADYRADGHGRPAYEPSMMVALLLYAYATGNRSSRAIERACVAGRRLSGDLRQPRPRSLDDRRVSGAPRGGARPSCSARCSGSAGRAGLVSVGVIAIDGTKVAANASRAANRGYEQIAREILAEAAARPPRPRMSSTARRAAMSCLSGCGRARGGAPRCGRQRAELDRERAAKRDDRGGAAE